MALETGVMVRPQDSPAMLIHSFEDVRNISKIFMASGVFVDTKTEAQAIVKIMAGHEIGMAPFQSMSGIDIIRDKVVIKPLLLASKMKSSNKYNYRVIEQSAFQCVIDFIERGQKCGTATFSSDDAKKLGLLSKDNYAKQAPTMFFWRALAKGIRQFCPDLYGMPVYIEEEIKDEEVPVVPAALPVQEEPIITESVEVEPAQVKVKLLTQIHKKNMWTLASQKGYSKEDFVNDITTRWGNPEDIEDKYYDGIVKFIEAYVAPAPEVTEELSDDDNLFKGDE